MVGIRRGAGRQAAAGHQPAAGRHRFQRCLGAGFDLGRGQRGTGKDKAVLRAGFFLHDQVFAHLRCHRDCDMVHRLRVQHPRQLRARGAASRKHRQRIAAQPLQDPRDIDAAAARLALDVAATQLVRWHELFNVARNVDRRIQGQGHQGMPHGSCWHARLRWRIRRFP
jgi:hypothetical protein